MYACWTQEYQLFRLLPYIFISPKWVFIGAACVCLDSHIAGNMWKYFERVVNQVRAVVCLQGSQRDIQKGSSVEGSAISSVILFTVLNIKKNMIFVSYAISHYIVYVDK